MDAAQRDVLSRLGGLIPRSASGWTAAGPGEIYDPETIFAYIDGAGEVYRAYNFRHLLSLRFEKPDRPGLVVDLFDMGSPGDAFGVNTMDLEGEDPRIGQGGTYKEGLLSFWRDRYFVSIAADSETPESRAGVLDLGRRIEAAIGKDGLRPALLDRLPPGLAAGTAVRYLHSHVILNRHVYVHAENVFQLGPEVEAVLARMGAGGRDGALLIVKYPSPAAAASSFAGVAAALVPGSAGISAEARTANGRWNAARLRRDMIAVVLGAVSAEAARSALDKVEARSKSK